MRKDMLFPGGPPFIAAGAGASGHDTLALRSNTIMVYCKMMSALQEQYDEAMFAFSRGEYDSCIGQLKAILEQDAAHFEAQLALGMAYYRQGDYASALREGHKAETIKPREQLVHTNLSLFYMKAGDKKTAEHHGLQARIASWREDKGNESAPASNPELEMAKPSLPSAPQKFPDMPWKKKPPAGSAS